LQCEIDRLASPLPKRQLTATRFSTGVRRAGERNSAYEKLHENPVFHFCRSDVHGLFCGGQASRLQKERQELSDERQQGMQLREGVRLQGSKYAKIKRTFRKIDN
jgi:hypothetical protein